MKGTCQCGENVSMIVRDGTWQFLSHACAKRPLNSQNGERQATSSGDEGKSSSGRLALGGLKTNAKRTKCGCGRTHPSKLQARVCARLRSEIEGGQWPAPPTLYHEVVMPLFRLAPKPSGKAFTICVDFVLVGQPGWVRYIDAKSPGFVSRDWPARAAAFAAQYGQAIEEVDH